MRILLDTNILLRIVEAGHSHHRPCLDAIQALRQRNHELVLTPQILYEFWSVATRPRENNGLGLSPDEAHSEVIAIQRLFRLLRDERGVFPIWEQLVVSLGIKGKQTHDARIAAAMKRHSVNTLLTYNVSDFIRYAFVTILTPIDVISGTATV